MTWKSFHNRGETLRSVISATSTRRDGILPMDVEGVTETFHGELDLLAALQLRWYTRLAGQVDRALLNEPMDLESAVVHAWCETAAELPGVRLVLDRYRSEPLDEAMATAMTKATDKEHVMLAVMTGQASWADTRTAAPLGARIEERARHTHRGVPVIAPAARPSLLERLKAVVAA